MFMSYPLVRPIGRQINGPLKYIYSDELMNGNQCYIHLILGLRFVISTTL